jgi:hypothetical protein
VFCHLVIELLRQRVNFCQINRQIADCSRKQPLSGARDPTKLGVAFGEIAFALQLFQKKLRSRCVGW